MDDQQPRGDGPRKRHSFPGDDRRSAWNRGPEIIAAEERILLYADALLAWMRSTDLGTLMQDPKVVRFMTHSYGSEGAHDMPNPFGKPMGVDKTYLLEKLDPDNNRMLAELLRAAWELRCWKTHYGEMAKDERDNL